MTWLFTLMAMAVIALVAGVVTGRIGGGMDAPESSLPFRGLPPDGVLPEDLEALRFTPAVRGYRMNQVDEVLDQLTQELRRRDDELARLRAALNGRAGDPNDPDEYAEPDRGDARPLGDGGVDGDGGEGLQRTDGQRTDGDAFTPPAAPSDSPRGRV